MVQHCSLLVRGGRLFGSWKLVETSASFYVGPKRLTKLVP